MADPYPHLSMPLLSLEICIIFLASWFFSSLWSHSSSQSHFLTFAYPCCSSLILFQVYYILFEIWGPEQVRRWRKNMDLCHGMATFAVLSTVPFLIIPNAWFTYPTTTEHWNKAFIKLYTTSASCSWIVQVNSKLVISQVKLWSLLSLCTLLCVYLDCMLFKILLPRISASQWPSRILQSALSSIWIM